MVVAAILVWILVASLRTHTSFDYNGQWTGNRHLIPGEDRYATYTLGQVDLKIQDEKFDLVDAGLPTSGKIDYEGDHIVLHTDSVLNLPLSHGGPNAAQAHPDIVMKGNADGTLTFDDPAAVDHKPLVLKRKPK